MGTRDHSDKTPKGGKKSPRPRTQQEPAATPVTRDTKYQDTEQVIEHNPLSGRPKAS